MGTLSRPAPGEQYSFRPVTAFTRPLDPKHRSRQLTEGPARAPARAYLKGIGFDDEALAKPIIGVAST